MFRTLVLAYGLTCYLVFFFTFLYSIGFVGNLYVQKSIDSGEASGWIQSVVIDVLLLALFAVQHSVMARPAFKTWWTRWVPRPMERSTYVLFSSLVLVLLFWQWRPLTGVVWQVDNEFVRMAILGMFWLGWVIVLVSTFLINHFDLFGLRQTWLYLRGRDAVDSGFVTPLFYRLVRHPIMLGFIIAFWATPRMTTGHLLFAAVTTAYILVALRLEERDLLNAHGATYADYRRQVPMILPFVRRSASRHAARGEVTEPGHEQ